MVPQNLLREESQRRTIEPFVDCDRAAEFLSVTRRRVLEMARKKKIPAHPIGQGSRKTWRFRLSELARALSEKSSEVPSSKVVSSRRAVS
jgi:excisionase family DNA binding protein